MTKDELVVKVLYLAYLVNARTEFCVFASFFGHVDQLSIRVAASKENYQAEVMRSETSLRYGQYRRDGETSLVAELKAKVGVLEQILQTHEIPYEDLEYEEIVERSYRF